MQDLPPYPFSEEFQVRVVALCLVDRRFYARHERFLSPRYFTSAPARFVAESLQGFFESHRAVPSREMLGEVVAARSKSKGLKADAASAAAGLVEAIASVPPVDAEWVRDRLLDWAKTQVIARTAMDLSRLYEDSAKTGEAKSGDMLKIMSEAVSACADVRGDFLDYFHDVVPRVYSDFSALKVPTGYATLDAALEGGVDRGELLLFLGGPSMGKTSLLVGAVRGALLNRYRVLVVTNEVSPRRWAARVDRAITGKTRQEILAAPRASIKLIERLRQVQGRMIIKGFPSGAASVRDVDAFLDELRDVEDFVPDVVVVDYSDELRSESYPDDTRLGQIDNVRRLRALGQVRDVPVLTASQAGKQAEGKAIVKMRDAAEAYGKNFVADVVVSLNQTEEEAAKLPYPECRLYGAKNREGERGFNLPYLFRPDRGIIVPATDAPKHVVKYGAAS